MIPGFERAYVPGTHIGLVAAAPSHGVAICKDMDFPSWARAYSRAGVGIMFVPALDFVVDDGLHARSAILRGVEGGYAVARAGQLGVLTISDHFGRVVGRVPTSSTRTGLMLGEVAPGPGRTPYASYGDWFPWLAGIGLAALLVLASKARTIRPDEPPHAPEAR